MLRTAISSKPISENTFAANCARKLPVITREARRYAIWELARRAGVSRDFFRQWVIEGLPDRTVVTLGPESKAKIEFLHDRASVPGYDSDSAPSLARAAWMGAPTVNDADLIIPFCKSYSDDRAPLYSLHGETLLCRRDLLSSILFTLARVEETLCAIRDEHGRFPASASLGFRNGFLERPILDEHGLAFQQALQHIIPGWSPELPHFRMKLTHDIDDIGMPFQFRSAIAHTLKRGVPAATLRDLTSSFTFAEPTELRLVRELARISTDRGIKSAFYWKGSPAGAFDSGYDPRERRIQSVVEFLRERNFEIGVHPGYTTFCNHSALEEEVEYLRRVLRLQSPGGRQHYLRWSPETWRDWEACGLSYDSSLGFADQLGFRAGTAWPYRPWSFSENRELDLLEIPLILMDCTPIKYLKLHREAGLDRIKQLVERVRKVGGVFTLLWHNVPLIDPDYDGWYEPILDMLDGVRPFEQETTDLLW